MDTPDPARLRGRRAIVTGGARGIGLACAQRLAAEGAAVLVADIERAAGEAAVADLVAQGARAVFHHADVAQADALPAIVEAAVSALGGVEILINNAGIAPQADFFELSQADYERVLAINLTAPFLLTQSAARHMREAGSGGAVINLSSVNALLNLPDRLAYCVSKGGLNQLTRNCAIALAPFGIRVNAIGPGTIATEMVSSAGLGDEALRPILARTPLGRLGRPAEIAAIAAFLASDDASYITGQTLYADGGRLGLNYTMKVGEH